MTGPDTRCLQECLDRLRAGDPAAREALLRTSQERLRRLTRKMLQKYPGVRRWEETEDVLQNVLVRLDHMLRDLAVADVRHYLRLSAAHIRRELIDLARHYGGPQGQGTHHATPPPRGGGPDPTVADDPLESSSGDPVRLAAWSELHRQIGQLPDEECEIFDLLWYQGLTREQAAELLGISLSTVKRRWQAARLRLAEVLGDDLPL